MDQNTTPNNNVTIPTAPRSSVAAGLLGIFLGGFGAHNWYLGQKTKGLIHICLTGGGFVIMILGSILVGLGAGSRIALFVALGGFLAFIAYIAVLGSSIWGLVEGIMLLIQGDAGLAAKGYTVAAPVAYTQPAQPAQDAQPAQPAETPAASSASTDSAKPASTSTSTSKSSAKSDSKKSPKSSSKK